MLALDHLSFSIIKSLRLFPNERGQYRFIDRRIDLEAMKRVVGGGWPIKSSILVIHATVKIDELARYRYEIVSILRFSLLVLF